MDFTQRLERKGLKNSTREKYVDIVKSSEGHDLLQWVQARSSNAALGTVLPMRAAVKHYLIAEHGYTADELDSLLPEAKGRPATMHEPLSEEGLALYHAAVDQLDPGAIRVILMILPMTGLRITEACTLQREQIRWSGNDAVLQVSDTRSLPLTPSASEELADYLREKQPQGYLFAGRFGGEPITDHTVRKYTRAMRDRHPELGNSMSPESLRHTYAVMALRRGVTVEQLRLLMGHENASTTQRYVESAFLR